MKKTEDRETILYVNRYYEKNLTTSQVTTYYYLGDKLVARRTLSTFQYVHQDHLTGASVVPDGDGVMVSPISYLPYGECLESQGTLTTDRLFTGQRLDGTGLYYYGARYYDPTIGRFISPDTVVPNAMNPQAFNRYSYVLNNPLKYIDPSGMVFVAVYDVDPNSFWDMWTLASLSSQIEDAYRGMMDDSSISAEERMTLQRLHDSQNVVVEFGVGNAERLQELKNVPGLLDFLPADYDEGKRIYAYEWIPRVINWPGQGWEGAWHRDERYGQPDFPLSLTLDTVAFTADAASFVLPPPANGAAYAVSSMASGVGLIYTGYKWNKGKATDNDLVVSWVTFWLGNLPYIGIVPAGYQLWWDTR